MIEHRGIVLTLITKKSVRSQGILKTVFCGDHDGAYLDTYPRLIPRLEAKKRNNVVGPCVTDQFHLIPQSCFGVEIEEDTV